MIDTKETFAPETWISYRTLDGVTARALTGSVEITTNPDWSSTKICRNADGEVTSRTTMPPSVRMIYD
jgi:hypothetical protein